MLKPLLLCLTEKGHLLKNSTVIDKIVGGAAAYLCALGHVKNVYTPLASQFAQDVLKEHNITLRALKIIPQIMNRNNSGPCPMELLALSSGSPENFFNKLKARSSG